MEKYLYLTEVEWEQSWIMGGTVPLFSASKYRSESRSGIFTPDENVIDTSSHDYSSLSPHIHIEPNCYGRVTVVNSMLGNRLMKKAEIDRRFQDGVVLCLANICNVELATKLGKKVCLRVKDVKYLKEILDSQIGSKGIMRNCTYRKDHIRDLFTKSVDDAWQHEFRIFWANAPSQVVTLPKDIAEREFIVSGVF